ncbi:late embryogenesis abundant protein Lea5-D [Cornus florida]|uniref:late embryogenesis abundant protein Lea5-D n=1 Tax=Cornus florida TaxID=4283 RepID=UPI00289F0FA7|nr:late embryogenesis abundant protein Lea5-D [Cornus florida]
MARYLTNAKLLATSTIDGLSFNIIRRGYAATSQGAVVAEGGSSRGMVGKVEGTAVIKEKSAWVPDPITGYYKPTDRPAEIDAVELREMLLNHKVVKPQ